jgi:hypothetical protein
MFPPPIKSGKKPEPEDLPSSTPWKGAMIFLFDSTAFWSNGMAALLNI